MNMHGSSRTEKSGFTLVELLIVIAVIGILAAILFPVFARARENARRASCQSNLKQIGLGVAQYTQDYDERYPHRSYNSSNESWRTFIYPYVKSSQIYQCPSGNRAHKNQAGQDLESPYTIKASYAANENIMASTVSSTAIATILKPAELIFAGEETTGDSIVKQDATLAQVTGGTRGPWAGHLGPTSNYLFVDGHVKAMRPTRTVPSAVFSTTSDNFWVNTYATNTAFDILGIGFTAVAESPTGIQTNARTYMQALEDTYD